MGTATDWWGWAATLAYAASGRAPFGRGPMDVVLDRVRRGDSDLTGVDPRLRPLLAAALAVDPAARPAAREVLDALERYADGGAATVALPTAAPTLAGTVRERPRVPDTPPQPWWHDGDPDDASSVPPTLRAPSGATAAGSTARPYAEPVHHAEPVRRPEPVAYAEPGAAPSYPEPARRPPVQERPAWDQPHGAHPAPGVPPQPGDLAVVRPRPGRAPCSRSRRWPSPPRRAGRSWCWSPWCSGWWWCAPPTTGRWCSRPGGRPADAGAVTARWSGVRPPGSCCGRCS
ncbi:hypothetical protein GCM10025868_28810 [Angustibacter aerolatus]|uniref:Protein kinase domain-containing protein n=1 Tax=Angustibacter aerolatus TaxID=1162965 RepID=A0ABQ6JJ93_9ACTN|nr:hypothetical protein GCM10025868_28810 [Angustibacter aerolatus]